MPSTKLTHGPGTLGISSRATSNPEERKQDLPSVAISDPVRTNMSDIPGSIEEDHAAQEDPVMREN